MAASWSADLRICIPLPAAPGGGSLSFFRNLRTWLDARGLAHTADPGAGADLVFANAWTVPAATIARAKRAGATARVVHRIDGSAVDYGRDAASDLRQALVNLWADATVFQSAYGREATRRRRVILTGGPVVHNPVDVERFRPEGARADLPGRVRIAHVTFSTNEHKGVEGVWRLARRRPDLTFVMVGRYAAPPALANVVLLGETGWDRLPAVLRACDAFLFLAEREACPNVVLEAMATGVPVLYKPSGGTPELVGEAGLATDEAGFDRALEEVRDRRAALAEAGRRRVLERFTFDAVFPRYLEAGLAAERRPPPGAGPRLATLWRVRPGPVAAGRWLARRARGRLSPAASRGLR